MRKQTRIFALAITIVAILVVAHTPRAVGYSDKSFALATQNETSGLQQKPVTAYIYVAKPGENLTLLVRRSLKLYAGAKGVRLTKPALIYAETNVVKQLGSKPVNVGEQMHIPFDLLQKYIVASRHLTPPKRAAWAQYAAEANFTQRSIQPVNVQAAQQATTPQTSSTSIEKHTTPDETKEVTSEKRPLMAIGLLLACVIWVIPKKRSSF